MQSKHLNVIRKSQSFDGNRKEKNFRSSMLQFYIEIFFKSFAYQQQFKKPLNLRKKWRLYSTITPSRYLFIKMWNLNFNVHKILWKGGWIIFPCTLLAYHQLSHSFYGIGLIIAVPTLLTRLNKYIKFGNL